MEPALPAETAQLPQPSLALTDPHQYLAQPQFHRSFRCQKTQRRVTYADAGDPHGPPVVYFLPSMCSRYLCIMNDGLAKEVGVRLIGMDRPGCGGTEQCGLNERLRVTSEMTESLLEHLNLRHVSLVAASAGAISMVHYVQTHPERLSPTHPTVALLSPWAPGNVWLPLVPAGLVANSHKVVPAFGASVELFSGSKDLFASLLSAARSAVVSSSQKTHHQQSTDAEEESYTFDSGQTGYLRRSMGLETLRLAQTYMHAESVKGLSEEYLLLLGKGVEGSGAQKAGSREWLAASVSSFGAAFGDGGRPPLAVMLWWGENDGLVPREARGFLDGVFDSTTAVDFQRHELKGSDHDEPMCCMEGVGEALRCIRARAEEADWASAGSA